MPIKEIRLKINVEGIVQACQHFSSKDSKVHTINHTYIDYSVVLEDILCRNLEIESGLLTGEEKKAVLDIIKNDMHQHFIYNECMVHIIRNLYFSLVNKESRYIRNSSVHLINEVIKPNTLIYKPEHGIHRKHDKNKEPEKIDPYDASADLSPRVYTLEVGDTQNPLGLESMLQSASESLYRDIFCYVPSLVYLLGMHALENYTHTRERYTLDELYTLTHKETGASLVDYGLRLIHDKYYEISDLIWLTTAVKSISNDPQVVAEQINEVLGPEDLKIVFSIGAYLKEIAYEKRVLNCMVRAVEYMARNTSLLKGRDGSNTLIVTTDLEDFVKDYITSSGGIKKLVAKKKAALEEEIKRKYRSRFTESRKCEELEASLQEPTDENSPDVQTYSRIREEKSREIESLQCSINGITNDIYLLECDAQKEDLESESILEFLYRLEFYPGILSLAQREYILRKIEEHGEGHGIKVVKARKLFSVKLTHSNIIKMLIAGAVLVVVSGLLAGFAKNRMKVADGGYWLVQSIMV
ncbi:hypothetical protein NEMIN01_0252 [Nematocida minor]|uniref:uncharacterized protein n=1 Tax=Nematocida minor TaxID=1912983 RepID=UPI002220FE73|nr:uncharacterized protein NEMIN01_0252 [Nematocida minor]KAI5188988.1 hypothetical protein NEMIN01_0252 [Nematocida minor]